MYAIFMTGGKQYKVEPGDVLRIEKISGDVGDKVKFENVIAFSDADGSLNTGTPYLDATVNATITDAGRGGKVIIFKFKAKKNYRRKQGHRQPYTEIEVDNFTVGGKDFGEKPEKPEPAAEEVPEDDAAEAPAEEEAKTKKAKSKKTKTAAKTEALEVVEEGLEVLEEELEKAETKAEEKKASKAKAKAKKSEEAVEPKEEPAEEKPAKAAKKPKAEKAPGEEKAAKAVKEPKEEKPEASTDEADASRMTKADITAKLDELGVTYLKSAKKDELLAQLNEAEGK